MGEKDDVMVATPNTYQITKKVCLIFLALAVASCVLVGLLVYYTAMPPSDCIWNNNKNNIINNINNKVKKVTDVLLPRHLVPEHYKVQLVPFLANFTIRGYVEVTMLCSLGGSNNITLHINDMKLDNDTVVVEEMGKGRIKVVENRYDREREFYIAMLGEELKEGKKYVIKIHFVAQLRDDLKGFYRSTYKDENGVDRILATTQFEATDARRAFPCFDEPALKAKFEVSLGRTKNMTSISNMPVREASAPMNGSSEYVWDHYEVSVPMSTYLVACVVSDFDYQLSPPETGNNIQFRIWARKNALNQIEYANSIGAKMLRHFEQYFGIDYPLPKQDMIALPDMGGAMENWGLITYMETYILFKPGVSSTLSKQGIALTVSHELAHQWFGNLVTTAWWTDLWLNEGFATYVQYIGVEAVQPEMKVMEQFVPRVVQMVMSVDSLSSSHPISIPVKHPDEIHEIFDSISYSKGATIIRMMENFLSAATFKRGLTNYLKAFSFKAATQDDLWKHLTEQAHGDGTLPADMTVKTIMDTWTLQMGFPVVTVNRNYQDNTATLTQERFLSIPSEKPTNDTHAYQWWVPITFTIPGSNFNNTYSSIWLKPGQGPTNINGLPSTKTPVVFNVQEIGYYRVNYDLQNWNLLTEQLQLNHTQIHVMNRAQLIDDAFNLAKAGLLDYKVAFGLTAYLDKEREYIVWHAFFTAMGYIRDMLERSPAYGEFRRYMKHLVKPIYDHVGYDSRLSDSHLDILLRGHVVSWGCKLDMVECTDRVKESYGKWMKHPNPDSEEANEINVEMKNIVYCNAIRMGGEKEWLFAWQRYQQSNVASEKSTLMESMACSRDTWLLTKYLNTTLTPNSGIRLLNVRSVISAIVSNVAGRDLAFNFIRAKWEILLKIYAENPSTLTKVALTVMKNRNTRLEMEELVRFEGEHRDLLSRSEREVRQIMENCQSNILWMDNHYEDIYTLLQEQNKRF